MAVHPRTASEIVDAAVHIVRRNYLALLTVTAIGYLPFTLVQMTVFRQVMARAGAGTILQSSRMQVLYYYGFAILWSVLIDLTLTVAVSEAYGGRPIDVASVLRRSLPRSGATLVATIVKYGSIVLLALVCLLPVMATPTLQGGYAMVSLAAVVTTAFVTGGCYVIGLFFASTAAIALEGAGPIAALRRSAQLSKNHLRHVLAALALGYAIYFVGLLPIMILAGSGARLAAQFLSVAATILLVPVLSTTRVILYYDLRIRNEGYDLELMAQRVATAGAALPSN